MVRALAAVVACMAVVACAGEPWSAPSPMSVESVGVSPSEVETFVDPMPDPPELTLLPEGDDFEPVIREIFAFRGWLFGHPDRDDLVSEIYHQECPCHMDLRADLTELRGDGQRVFGSDHLTKLVLRDDRPESKFFVVERTARSLVLVDGSGAVIDRLEEATPTRSLWQVTPSDDGRWRVASIRSIEK